MLPAAQGFSLACRIYDHVYLGMIRFNRVRIVLMPFYHLFGCVLAPITVHMLSPVDTLMFVVFVMLLVSLMLLFYPFDP